MEDFMFSTMLLLKIFYMRQGIMIKQMINQYGSIMEIGEASVEELCKIDGIGKILAERILNTLHSENNMEI